MARKGVGVGDKCLVGVAGFNLAAWNVGEREATHEAWSSLPHNGHQVIGLSMQNVQILRFPWPAIPWDTWKFERGLHQASKCRNELQTQ